jgi:serine/threonine protein kinase
MHSFPPGSPRLADGRFVVVGRARRGSLSTVWRVYDELSADWRTLRLLDDNVATQDDARLFAEVSRALVVLYHPNVVTLHEVGTLKGNAPFVLTEFVPGATLGRALSRVGPLGPRSAGLLVLELVDALMAVHQLGLVHREISTEHVLIGPNGASRLSDFDAALPVGQTSRRIAGVVGFRAPEQIAAEVDPARGPPADPRTDIYALGVLLWSLLRGEVPRNANRVSSDPSALGDVDEQLGAVVRRCLATRLEDRYPSMDALAEELLTAVSDAPEEDEIDLTSPPEEQSVSQPMAELGRYADGGADRTPAWMRDGTVDPATPAGKSFVTPPMTAAAKVFTPVLETPPSGRQSEPPGPMRRPAEPLRRVPPPAETPGPGITIGLSAEAPSAESQAPSWLEQRIVPLAMAIAGVSLGTIAMAATFGMGMYTVQGAHEEVLLAQEELLELVDLQRPFVERSRNAGAPQEVESAYMNFLAQKTTSGRLEAARAFVGVVEEMNSGRPTPEGVSDPRSPDAVARKLRSARDRVDETEAAWQDASTSGVGRLAVGLGLARGPGD